MSGGSRPFGIFTRTADWCGADKSAGKTRHTRSRDGDRYLKLVFHTAAIRAAQYHPEIRQEYRRLARRKGKIVARALIAEELASTVYYVLPANRRRPMEDSVDPS